MYMWLFENHELPVVALILTILSGPGWETVKELLFCGHQTVQCSAFNTITADIEEGLCQAVGALSTD